MLLASDGITIGEKWTTVLPSKIGVDFFYSVWNTTSELLIVSGDMPIFPKICTKNIKVHSGNFCLGV